MGKNGSCQIADLSADTYLMIKQLSFPENTACFWTEHKDTEVLANTVKISVQEP